MSQVGEEWCDFPDPHGNGSRILVIVFLFAERKNSRDVVWDCLSQELDGSSWPSTREAEAGGPLDSWSAWATELNLALKRKKKNLKGKSGNDSVKHQRIQPNCLCETSFSYSLFQLWGWFSKSWD